MVTLRATGPKGYIFSNTRSTVVKRNLVTIVVAIGIAGAVFAGNAYLSPARAAEAQQKAAKEAAEKVAQAEAEAKKAKDETLMAKATEADAAKKAEPAAAAPAAAPAAPAAPVEVIAEWPAAMPDVYKVRFETTKGDIIIECRKEWAPLGAERFYQLCKEGFYNNTAFFRVVPGFVVQFGLAADPAVTAAWSAQEMPDDPVKQTNAPGTVTFASRGPNTRTTQVFINYGDNKRLDGMGFQVFGKIIQGMEVATSITAQYGEKPNQGLITSQGDEYISKFFPEIDKIKHVSLIK